MAMQTAVVLLYFDRQFRVEQSFDHRFFYCIKIPDTLAFDTYALKGASKDEIKSVEQGKS